MTAEILVLVIPIYLIGFVAGFLCSRNIERQ